MLKFLYNQKELTNPKDTILSDLDVMYDRLILCNATSVKSGTIYIFGTSSPHGKRFIALIGQIGMDLLETKNLPIDMQAILTFLQRNKINSQQGYKCLKLIAETYQYNEKRNFRPTMQEK
ncbi:hypothetical protein SAMN05421821_10265 [Mucilaginibacter lappiensis]|uniref:Uncharacterized protein n=1 Tax=Mucilaginibacter lappiensis TaxID=354630 RepID=A0ABR6PG08_9SPHI|nr:hypothetical protein [Mucilaginibacter lappiensis]MBB6108700.1 hypothetical protein [Mucilaginibacter lappiensis]SIQ27285.1 hypothetical protein SAMN05421821_10265 [Mucilaginibacter lappiensis]